MANATPDRIGQINGSGAVDALFLKVFAGEVITAFEGTNVMMDKHSVRQISNGKSASFPRLGKIAAEYHTPGAEITGLAVNHGEAVITIDDLLISHNFLANIDEAKNHYDVRAPISTEMGRTLAKQMDAHVMQTGVLAARSANQITDLPGGSVILTGDVNDQDGGGVDFLNSGADLMEGIFAAAETLDGKDVPDDQRYVFLRPAQYYQLVRDNKLVEADESDLGEGTIYKLAGMTLVKTNNLPRANVQAGTVGAGTADKYAGDFTNTAALVMHPRAVGTVKLLDLGMEAEYDIRRQGYFMVAKYAVGHGILMPEAAIEIRNSAT